jgi:hypothetical protein
MSEPTEEIYTYRSSSATVESFAQADSEYERQRQRRKILVDHENEISVHKIFSSTEADDKPPVEGYIIHEGGKKLWVNEGQAQTLIDMLQNLFDA